MTKPNANRLNILTPAEITELYGLPQFGDEERRHYFDMSAQERQVVEGRRSAAGIFLALELGYFKAKRQFFDFTPAQVTPDLRYLAQHFFSRLDVTQLVLPSSTTRTSVQQAILGLAKYRAWDTIAKDELTRRMQRFAALSTQPLYILRESLQHLSQQRCVAPRYSTLQDMIGGVIAAEMERLTQLLVQQASAKIVACLDAILLGSGQELSINAIKREPKNFGLKELRLEVQRRQFFHPLHEFANAFLTSAGLSQESGKYYASLVPYYTQYKLQRMPRGAARLYLLCFALHRYRQINDNLIGAFIYLVGQFDKQAKAAAMEAMGKATTEANANLGAAGEVLNLFVDESIAEDSPFIDVKARAFSLLDPQSFASVSNYLRNVSFDRLAFEWEYLAKLSMTIKRNLRHLFCELDFAGRVQDAPLVEAIGILQGVLRQHQSPRHSDKAAFPSALIPKHLRRYLYPKTDAQEGEGKVLDIDRYEFLVYRLLRNALESGDIFVTNSHEFRQFEYDLISDVRWKDKATLLAEIDAPLLLAPISHTLEIFRQALATRYSAVNQRIADSLNQHIKIAGQGEKKRWKLVYPTEKVQTNHAFYAQLPSIAIADLLRFVVKETGFLEAFSHVLGRHAKSMPNLREILACVVAFGTNMGLGKMAEVSGLSYATLLTTARNMLRPETLRGANDAISNATAKLPAFELFNIRDEVHSSSDGQRMETKIDTFNARYSPKYFGLDKGVSACTVVANHVPINARIIGTHEHESHYVFDLLYNNTSEIRPTRHSTDTHGTNHVNFWTLRTFGYGFAPRYKDLRKKTASLVSFEAPSTYAQDVLIRPSYKVDTDLIIREWPNIQRIMASLAQKDTTQATIVRKLSSYARQNQTKKALWELDNICRTLYILDFIDDVDLRQSVQKALNRGEAFHRFRRAVAFVNGGKFKVQTEAEQQVWNDCSRLIANAVIYYNTMLLSQVYERKLAAGDTDAVAAIRRMSPVAWQHVNLFGTFEFSDEEFILDMEELLARYADETNWRQATQEGEDDEFA